MNTNWKKNIILFLASQTITLLGSSLVQFAITWHITLETQSGSMMTISILCGLVPTFFLAPFGGVWADRYSKKLLIILSDSLIAISTLILAILFLLGYDSIWLLFLISAIRAVGSGIQTPAINALIPSLIPEEQLTKINATNSSIQSFIYLISPMASGALLSIASIELIFFIDVITAFLAVVLLIFWLAEPKVTRRDAESIKGYFEEMKQGVAYIFRTPFIKKFFLYAAGFFLISGPVSFLTPLQVARSFGDDVWRLTAVEVAFSIGMLIGGIVIAFWGGFKNKIHTMILSSFAMSICTFLLGVMPLFWIYLGVMGLFGLVMPFFNTPSMVLLQEKVETDYLGRVFGVFHMIVTSMLPISIAVFGPMADRIPIEILFILSGFAMIVLTTFMLRDKTLLEAGKAGKVSRSNY